MMIDTGDKIINKTINRDTKTIGFFSNIDKFPKDAKYGNRAILIDGNTFEYDGQEWKDLGIFEVPIGIIGPKGETGPEGKTPIKGIDFQDGKDGKDADPIDYEKLNFIVSDIVYNKLKGDREFINKCKGEKGDSIRGDKGDNGKTPIKGIDYRDGVDGKTPIKGTDYFDGKTPTKEEIMNMIDIQEVVNKIDVMDIIKKIKTLETFKTF